MLAWYLSVHKEKLGKIPRGNEWCVAELHSRTAQLRYRSAQSDAAQREEITSTLITCESTLSLSRKRSATLWLSMVSVNNLGHQYPHSHQENLWEHQRNPGRQPPCTNVAPSSESQIFLSMRSRRTLKDHIIWTPLFASVAPSFQSMERSHHCLTLSRFIQRHLSAQKCWKWHQRSRAKISWWSIVQKPMNSTRWPSLFYKHRFSTSILKIVFRSADSPSNFWFFHFLDTVSCSPNNSSFLWKQFTIRANNRF